MDRLQWLISRYLYYEAYQRLRQAPLRDYRQTLMENCHRTPEDIQETQRRKLTQLVHHAYDHVPYYRRIFDERAVRPGDIRESRDLEKLPVLTKSIVQEQGDQLLSAGSPAWRRSWRTVHTGGSTGEPVTVWQDDRAWFMGVASVERSFFMTGWHLGDKRAWLWGRHYDSTVHNTWRWKLIDWGLNQYYVDAYHRTESDMISHARKLAKLRPRLLIAMVSSLMMMARLISEHNIEEVRPEAIQTTAETLTPTQRAIIESAFGCKVYDRYGCAELHTIGQECSEHKGIHLFTDLHVVEFLDGVSPVQTGQPGAVAVTGLDNYAMPLIRYVIGDIATPAESSCPCGLPFPVMSSIQGRTFDVIISPSGRRIYGLFFSEVLDTIPEVRQFQVIQEAPDLLTIRIVPGSGFGPSTISSIEGRIHDHGDPAFQVDVQTVDRIESEASGKYRSVVSRVASE